LDLFWTQNLSIIFCGFLDGRFLTRDVFKLIIEKTLIEGGLPRWTILPQNRFQI